jgi:hypothetical protein
LNEPSAEPNASCIASLQPPAFATQSDVLPITSIFRVVSLTEQGRSELLAFIAGLLALLSAFAVLPLVWLLRKLMNRQSGPLPALAKWAPWLVLLNGIVLTLFFAMLAGFTLGASSDGDITFLFGLPASLRLWLLLPLISIVLTVLIFAGVVAGWRSGGWGWVRRILYPLYGVAGVVCLVVLGAWGMLVRPLFG